MDRYRIDVSEPAERDLQEISQYISAQFNAPMTALRMMDTRACIVDIVRILYNRRDWVNLL